MTNGTVDVGKADGSRTLVVPVIRGADRVDFAGFLAAYEACVEELRTGLVGALDPDLPERVILLRLLPVALSVGIGSVAGTQLAVRFGTKLIVTLGLVAMAAFYVWAAVTASATLGYGIIAIQVVASRSGPLIEALRELRATEFDPLRQQMLDQALELV